MKCFPLVSIIIPCHNVERYIRYAAFSLGELKYKHFEIIAVDDGSTDDTRRLLEALLDEKRDKIISYSPKKGLASALNEGLRAASGEFIARFDADDYMYDWRLGEQVAYLLGNPEIDLIGTAADLFGVTGGQYRSPLSYRDIINNFICGNPFIHPTIMFRRRLIDDGLFMYDVNMPTDEDYELWSRILGCIKCANFDRPSIRYRIHGNNNQRHPAKRLVKRKAVKQFLSPCGITDADIINAFAEFQCSGYVRPEEFDAMRRYALLAEKSGKPQAAWLHRHLLKSRTYTDFVLVGY
jgi:glycosyltransferase involved in cell wall biosynthesis